MTSKFNKGVSKTLAIATLATSLVGPLAAPMQAFATGAKEPAKIENMAQLQNRIPGALEFKGISVNTSTNAVEFNSDAVLKVKLGDNTQAKEIKLETGKYNYEVTETVRTNGVDKAVTIRVAIPQKLEAGVEANVKITVVDNSQVELANVAVKVTDAAKDATVNFEGRKVTTAEQEVAAKYAKQIKAVVKDGKAVLVAPATPEGYKATLKFGSETLNVTDKKSETGVTDFLKDGVIKGDVQVTVFTNDGFQVGTALVNIKEDLTQARPVINYAYVIDGSLIVNATSKAGMGSVPVYWRYSWEKDFRAISPDFGYGYNYGKKDLTDSQKLDKLFGKVTYDRYSRLDANDYRIPVEIPSKVQLVFVDANGKTTPWEVRIDKDNQIIDNGIPKAPAYVEQLIKSVTVGGAFSNVTLKDLLVIQKDTTVNLYDFAKTAISDTWSNFNTRELKWECDKMSSFDEFRIKFDREGRYVFTVTKDNSDKKVSFTVLVMEGKNNVKSFKVLKEVKATGTTFQPIKALDIVTTDGKAANAIGFYAKYDGKYYQLNDKVPFATEKNKNAKEAEVEIVDILNNRTFKVKFTQVDRQKMSIEEASKKFSDIKGHWARNRIITLVANGVIAGYPDGTFRPENKISVRETLAILGRYAETLDESKVTKAVNKEVTFEKATWGNDEVEYVLKRLPNNIFSGNLDREITREEVAYTMNHLYKYSNGTSGVLKDVAGSRFQTEIESLIAAGTIKGFPDGTFKPQLPISRAELTSMLYVIPGVTLEVKAPDAAVTTGNTKGATSTLEELNNLFK